MSVLARLKNRDGEGRFAGPVPELQQLTEAEENGARHMQTSLAPQILNAIPAPALLIDQDRRVLFANIDAQSTFRVASIGSDLAKSFRSAALLKAVDSVIEGAATANAEITLPGPMRFVFEVRVTALEPTHIRLIVLVFIDKTPTKQTEAIHSSFVANVSHELRSPLTTVTSAIEALEGPASDDSVGRRRLVTIMAQEARRMKGLIDDLLSLSSVEAHEYVAPDEQVAVLPIVEAVKERLFKRAKARGMQISIEKPPGCPPVAGKEDQLFQIFDNLVDNAIKYGNANSEIAICVMAQLEIAPGRGPGISISVTNQGPLIAPEHLPRLTERFYRVDKSRSRALGGTGLGLAIVKHILNRHRGFLRVESSEKLGNRFTVFLPITMQFETPVINGPTRTVT